MAEDVDPSMPLFTCLILHILLLSFEECCFSPRCVNPNPCRLGQWFLDYESIEILFFKIIES